MFRLSQCLVSWFYIGYSPIMPGTIGSLAALPCIWVCLTYGSTWYLAIFALVTLSIGLAVSQVYLTYRPNIKDPSEIVIDEVSGQAVTILIMQAMDPSLSIWLHLFIGFTLFRFFDITKPGPIRWCDKYLPGSYGVMFDDTVAGLFAGITAIFGAYLYSGIV